EQRLRLQLEVEVVLDAVFGGVVAVAVVVQRQAHVDVVVEGITELGAETERADAAGNVEAIRERGGRQQGGGHKHETNDGFHCNAPHGKSARSIREIPGNLATPDV